MLSINDSQQATTNHRSQEEEAVLRSFLGYLEHTSEYAGPAMRLACTALLNWHEHGGTIDASAFLRWQRAIIEEYQAYRALGKIFEEMCAAKKPVEVAL